VFTYCRSDCGVLGEAFAQGLLTPPSGDPAPSMKTLGQIEPRTPISVYNQLLEGGRQLLPHRQPLRAGRLCGHRVRLRQRHA
jgi:hypothetical protein